MDSIVGTLPLILSLSVPSLSKITKVGTAPPLYRLRISFPNFDPISSLINISLSVSCDSSLSTAGLLARQAIQKSE